MTQLLKLNPSAERLRRIAKAHAAGELGDADYRRIRGEVIDGFARGAAHIDFGDDTEPRWSEQPSVPVARAKAPPPRVRPRPRAWIIGAVLVAVVLMVVAARPLLAASVVIPPVAERDPNPFTSPRLQVHTVVVRNLPEFPHLGIDTAAVHGFLQERLDERVRAAAPGDHGFTADELSELGRLLSALRVHERGTTLSSADGREISALVEAQKSRRGLSLVELESLAADLSRFYRSRGVPLAIAYVPVQSVHDGIVELEVLPGVLTQTRVAGAQLPAEMVQRAFMSQMGAAVEADRVESVLYRINDLPGLRASGRFVAGEAVGSTVLDLQLDYERPWQARARVDNHGSERTGEIRTLLEGRWYNPSGRGDWLSAGVIAGWQPANKRFGYLEYRMPYRDLNTELGVRGGVDTFEWTDGEHAFSGDSAAVGLVAKRQLQRGRERSTALELGVARQSLALDDDVTGATVQDQALLLFTAAASDERVLPNSRLPGLQRSDLAFQLRLELDAARLDSGTGIDDRSAVRAGFAAGAWRMTALPGFGSEQKLRLALSGQVASGPLPGTLQRGLGGVRGSAGFDYPALSADDAVFGRIDFRFQPTRVREAGEIVLFVDAAHGVQKRDHSQDLKATLLSAGIGWEHRFLDQLGAQLMLAWPMAENSSGLDIERDGARLLFLLEYRP
jgi:hemolysin activation/secretion protein